MIPLLACFIYAAYLFVTYFMKNGVVDNIGLFIAFLVIGSIVTLIIGIIIARFIGLFIPEEFSKIPYLTADLGYLERDSKLTGSFCLGSGSINQYPYYFYYEKNEDGGYVPKQLAAGDNVVFFENKDTTTLPHVKVFTKEFTTKWLDWFAISSTEKKYEFHIPEGSIKAEYKP